MSEDSEKTLEQMLTDEDGSVSAPADNTDESQSSTESQQKETSQTEQESKENKENKESEDKGGKADSEKEDKGKVDGETEANKNKEETELSEEDLDKQAREALGLENKEPETTEVLKRRSAESAKEGKRLANWRKSAETSLAEQGLKFGEKADGSLGIVASEKYVAQKADEVEAKIYESLSVTEIELAVEDPEKFAQLCAKRGVELAELHPVPTLAAEGIEIPREEMEDVRDSMIAAKDKGGEPLYPNMEELEPYIQHVLEDKTTPDAFIDFMGTSAENYKYGLSVVYDKVCLKVAPLIAAQKDRQAKAKKKKDEAKESVSLTSEGTVGGKAKKATTDKTEAESIAGATNPW